MGWIRKAVTRILRSRAAPPAGGDIFQKVVAPDGRAVLADQITRDYWASTAPQPTQASLDRVWEGTQAVRVSELRPDETGNILRPSVVMVAHDPEGLAALRAALRIVDGGNGHCMCLGGPTFELVSAAGDVLARISQHHGRGVRWSAWKDDAALVDGERLLEWLDARGMPGPLERHRREVHAEEEAMAAWQRWVAGAPEAMTALPIEAQQALQATNDVHPLLEALEATHPNAPERILRLLAWYGSGSGRWTGFPEYEDFPRRLLGTFPLRRIVAALDTRSLSTAELDGAARLFARGDALEVDVDAGASAFPTGGVIFLPAVTAKAAIPDALRRRLRDHCKSFTDEENRTRADVAFGDS